MCQDLCNEIKSQQRQEIVQLFNCGILERHEAREMLGINKDTRPACPDCKQVMVKTHIELNDNSGWFTGWGCGCKYEPKG